ncbi:MAG: DNA methyltransferase [Myxococcales bacterium FL481]|nr:MAG: DNA methyltransferase [Myxococcales bacterium FL481]
MIKYLGSKRTLLPVIAGVVERFEGATSVLDLFSGTSRVGHTLKQAGYRVIANDHNAYAATLARCYVQADREDVAADAERLLGEFARLPGRAGYFTETFCRQSRFIHPRNGERIDAIRDAIAAKGLDPELESVVLVSLMEAADRVDSTCGVQMAYLKHWAARARNDLQLRMPAVLPRARHGKGQATQLDVFAALERFEADIVYLDPPYNQHSYLNNYHVWETLICWDRPEVYGIACKRTDCRTRKSPFNRKSTFFPTLERMIREVRGKVLLLSLSNEGYATRASIEPLLRSRGEVSVLSSEYPRYVGAKIGIYNPAGEKVGQVSHVRNVEYVYVVRTPAAPELERGGESPRDRACAERNG